MVKKAKAFSKIFKAGENKKGLLDEEDGDEDSPERTETLESFEDDFPLQPTAKNRDKDIFGHPEADDDDLFEGSGGFVEGAFDGEGFAVDDTGAFDRSAFSAPEGAFEGAAFPEDTTGAFDFPDDAGAFEGVEETRGAILVDFPSAKPADDKKDELEVDDAALEGAAFQANFSGFSAQNNKAPTSSPDKRSKKRLSVFKRGSRDDRPDMPVARCGEIVVDKSKIPTTKVEMIMVGGKLVRADHNIPEEDEQHQKEGKSSKNRFKSITQTIKKKAGGIVGGPSSKQAPRDESEQNNLQEESSETKDNSEEAEKEKEEGEDEEIIHQIRHSRNRRTSDQPRRSRRRESRVEKDKDGRVRRSRTAEDGVANKGPKTVRRSRTDSNAGGRRTDSDAGGRRRQSAVSFQTDGSHRRGGETMVEGSRARRGSRPADGSARRGGGRRESDEMADASSARRRRDGNHRREPRKSTRRAHSGDGSELMTSRKKADNAKASSPLRRNHTVDSATASRRAQSTRQLGKGQGPPDRAINLSGGSAGGYRRAKSTRFPNDDSMADSSSGLDLSMNHSAASAGGYRRAQSTRHLVKDDSGTGYPDHSMNRSAVAGGYRRAQSTRNLGNTDSLAESYGGLTGRERLRRATFTADSKDSNEMSSKRQALGALFGGGGSRPSEKKEQQQEEDEPKRRPRFGSDGDILEETFEEGEDSDDDSEFDAPLDDTQGVIVEEPAEDSDAENEFDAPLDDTHGVIAEEPEEDSDAENEFDAPLDDTHGVIVEEPEEDSDAEKEVSSDAKNAFSSALASESVTAKDIDKLVKAVARRAEDAKDNDEVKAIVMETLHQSSANFETSCANIIDEELDTSASSQVSEDSTTQGGLNRKDIQNRARKYVNVFLKNNSSSRVGKQVASELKKRKSVLNGIQEKATAEDIDHDSDEEESAVDDGSLDCSIEEDDDIDGEADNSKPSINLTGAISKLATPVAANSRQIANKPTIDLSEDAASPSGAKRMSMMDMSKKIELVKAAKAVENYNHNKTETKQKTDFSAVADRLEAKADEKTKARMRSQVAAK